MSAGVLGCEDLQMSVASLGLEGPLKVQSSLFAAEKPRSQLSADAPEFHWSGAQTSPWGSAVNDYDVGSKWGNNDSNLEWSHLLPSDFDGLQHLAQLSQAALWDTPYRSVDGFGAAPQSPSVPPPGVWHQDCLAEGILDHLSEPSTDLEGPAEPPPGLPPPGLVHPTVAPLAAARAADAPAEDASPRSDCLAQLLSSAFEDAEAAAKESMTLTPDAEGRGCWAEWVVRGQRLKSMDKQAVSPVFKIKFGSRGPTAFKMLLCPSQRNDARGGGSFKQGKGKGRIGLKCTDELGSDSEVRLQFLVVVGDGPLAQPVRGPLAHNFADHSCYEVGGQEPWNFAAAVDSRDTFVVRFLFEEAEPAQGEAAALAP